MENKHTAEPWEDTDFYADMSQMVVGEHILSIPDYNRARVCVNAMQGVSDPAGYIAARDAEVAGLKAKLDASEHLLESATAEVERLKAVNELDRTKVAKAYHNIRKAIDAHAWLRDSRGSYSYDDDRWHQEFAACIDKIIAVAAPLQRIAGDLTGCPTTEKALAEAYTLAARDAEVAGLKADCKGLNDQLDCAHSLADELRDKLAAVTTELDAMREALEFYADEQNYWSASSLRKNPMGRIETDNGAKARAALAKKGEASNGQ